MSKPTKLLCTLLFGLVIACGAKAPSKAAPRAAAPPAFELATSCMACHDRLVTQAGEDVSFGAAWRASMMANSARDPYWHAAVRREVLDHPAARAAIENECSRCHMPMAHELARSAGIEQGVFDHVSGAGGVPPTADPLARDGVSCSLCHQITSDRLGRRESFTGGFVINTAAGARTMFGPYDIERGHARVMESAVAAKPKQSLHIQRSEVCATCHSLYTHPLDDSGRVVGELPEQVPYEEWLHSEYRTTRSCQSCHMPVVSQPTAVTSVLGPRRAGVSRHDFRGANFFMLGILNVQRAELGVVATPLELDVAIKRTRSFLTESTARVAITRVERNGTRLEADVVVRNLAGHKLPTAYPSRRAWLRLTVRDVTGRPAFTSGELSANGAIVGNDNDRDAARFEPHHDEIRSADAVQIYEAILGGPEGEVTTGLLTAVSYLKDNRVLPRGFDKRTAPFPVKVRGAALEDPDFGAGSDEVRYVVEVGDAQGPFTIDAELFYQSIGFRWAANLRAYDALETRRFVEYYEAAASGSALRMAGDRARVP